MLDFEIKVFKGNKISGRKNGYVKHWAVFIKNQLTQESIFLKSFFTEQRAIEFIEKVKMQFAEGDYSCLTLRS